MRSLFESLHRKILAIDPCIGEEILKRSIAYKAEAKFADIVPQQARLLLVLNMPFPAVSDPKGRCRDLSGLGHWGSGDASFGIDSFADLDYALSLAHQAFEFQRRD